MTIGERIKNRRKELGYTVDQLAEMLGKNRATVYRYENGDIRDLPTQVLEPLADALKTTPADLMGWSTDAANFWEYAKDYNQRNFPRLRPSGVTTFPVLGEVACGKPIIANEQHDVLTTDAPINADAVLIARGDSMVNARIFDGDVVFIKFQPEVENGQIAAVIVENEDTEDPEVTLKRFFRYGPDLVVLRAENPAYADMEFHGEEINRLHIVGRAVALQTLL